MRRGASGGLADRGPVRFAGGGASGPPGRTRRRAPDHGGRPGRSPHLIAVADSRSTSRSRADLPEDRRSHLASILGNLDSGMSISRPLLEGVSAMGSWFLRLYSSRAACSPLRAVVGRRLASLEGGSCSAYICFAARGRRAATGTMLANAPGDAAPSDVAWVGPTNAVARPGSARARRSVGARTSPRQRAARQAHDGAGVKNAVRTGATTSPLTWCD